MNGDKHGKQRLIHKRKDLFFKKRKCTRTFNSQKDFKTPCFLSFSHSENIWNCHYANLGLCFSLVFGVVPYIVAWPSGRVACRVTFPCHWSFLLFITKVYHIAYCVYVLHFKCVDDGYRYWQTGNRDTHSWYHSI